MEFQNEMMEYVKKYKNIYNYKTNSLLYGGFYLIKENIIFVVEFRESATGFKSNDNDNEIEGNFVLRIKIKDMDYDEVYFNYDPTKEKVHITNTIRVNPGYDFMTLSEKKINIVYDRKNNRYIDMEEIFKDFCNDSMNIIDNFVDELKSNNIDIKNYIFLNRDKYPMEAGYEYISILDYENALNCFKIAEEKNYGKNIHVGSYGNYLVNVMISFCEKKLNE